MLYNQADINKDDIFGQGNLEIEWNGSIRDFKNEMALCFVFGRRDGAAPFLLWLEVWGWEVSMLCYPPL